MTVYKPEKMDKWDVTVSISSGALTALLDVLWVKDIDLLNAHIVGKDQIDKFVISIAKRKGYKGDKIADAIKVLEDDYPMAGDLLTNDFGGGSQHHLRDFSHHPTPVGLVFSILMQLTGYGFGTTSAGEFEAIKIPNWKQRRVEEAIYLGTIGWLFHMVSDIAGSSGARRMDKEGTGVPGPILSALKELSSIPGIRNIAGTTNASKSSNKESNYRFSVMCSKLFNGTLLGEHDDEGKIIREKILRFDLRTEVGIISESITNKQYVPVLINQLIVSSFYSVRKFLELINQKNYTEINQISFKDIQECLPWRNERLVHMRLISSSTLSVIDITTAGTKAYLNNKDDKTAFALDFIQGINYWGVASLALSSNSETVLALEKMFSSYASRVEKQKQKVINKLPGGQETYDNMRFATSTAISIMKIGTPIGFVSAAVGVAGEVKSAKDAEKQAEENRIQVEKECEEKIRIIEEYRKEIEVTVEDYFVNKMTVVVNAFDKMDNSILSNNIDEYILGNNMIQQEFAKKAMFSNKSEFDNLMLSDSVITF